MQKIDLLTAYETYDTGDSTVNFGMKFRLGADRNMMKRKLKAKAQRSHKLSEITDKAFDQLYERIRWLQAENNALAVKLSKSNERLSELEDMAKDAK